MSSIPRRSIALSTVSLVVLCIIPCFLPAQERDNSDLVSVVSQVQKNVATLRDKLPDFVCKEQATMQETVNGKVVKTSQRLSTLTAVRKYPRQNDGRFAESREVISATENGKQVKAQSYAPPVGVRGGFAEDLFPFFDLNSGKCYEFDLVGREVVRGRAAVVMNVKSKAGLQSLGPQCPHLSPGYSVAKVWIDSESLQVVRLEKNTIHELMFNGPFAATNGDYLLTPHIEYAPVSINNSTYWLPVEKRVEFVKVKGQRSLAYRLQYSDFHKFDVSMKIVSADLESH